MQHGTGSRCSPSSSRRLSAGRSSHQTKAEQEESHRAGRGLWDSPSVKVVCVQAQDLRKAAPLAEEKDWSFAVTMGKSEWGRRWARRSLVTQTVVPRPLSSSAGRRRRCSEAAERRRVRITPALMAGEFEPDICCCHPCFTCLPCLTCCARVGDGWQVAERHASVVRRQPLLIATPLALATKTRRLGVH